MKNITSQIVELTGETQYITFDNKAPYFMIKNLTDDIVYASFDTPIQDDKSTIVPANFGIIMFSNVPKLYLADDTHNGVYIMGTGAGSVEVMPLWTI